MEDREALNAAVAVAGSLGLHAGDPVILRDQFNVLVHLRPAPVAARVTGTIRWVRPGTAWQERELAIAGYLARRGAPAAGRSPELPPGPHEHDGRVLSLWRCDSHLNNVLPGPLWNDWEDTCLGPVGWDAACLLAGRHESERQEAAYAASGIGLDPSELELWVEARSLQIAVWTAFLNS